MTLPLPGHSESNSIKSKWIIAQNSSDDDSLLADDLLDEDSMTDFDEPEEIITNTGSTSKDSSDDLLLDEDSMTDFDEPEDIINNTDSTTKNNIDNAEATHLSLFAENRYPSANTCKTCHPKQYKEWSVSQHAYAQLSPVYMAMQNTINSLTSSTNGDFCIRCHNQVGMNMGESTFISNLERHPTSREGITCVVCHRLNNEYGKVSGRVALEEGNLTTPIYGPKGNEELKRVLDNTHKYRVVTNVEEKGRKIHADIGHFPKISTSSFCGICHDVNLFNGFRLEEAFSEYKNSPAAARNVSCQDCHMASVQGAESDYGHGPAAVVGGVPTVERKVTNHFFAGPDYSVIHPGIFPHNADAVAMASLAEWLQFDHEAGWGTDKFEDSVAEDYVFPTRWQSIDDRYDGREIIEQQFKLLSWATEQRREVLQNGYKLGAIETLAANSKGIKFRVKVSNGTDGHNVPTGFDAERLLWLEVTVKDSDSNIVFQSGDLDPNGDLRDSHSLYVHNGKLPLDKQLFNLQSRFVTRNVRGGEREQVLAVNYSGDPLPFVRPFTRSVMLTGQPAGARKHRQTLPPLTGRWAEYRIPAKYLTGSTEYNVMIKLKSAMVPINLINEIKDVGFDYGMSAKQVADKILAGHSVIWEKQLTITLQ